MLYIGVETMGAPGAGALFFFSVELATAHRHTRQTLALSYSH